MRNLREPSFEAPPGHGRLLPHEPRHHGDGRRLARPGRRAAAVHRLQRGVDQAPQSGEWHLLFQIEYTNNMQCSPTLLLDELLLNGEEKFKL